jgi:hypothetical protein
LKKLLFLLSALFIAAPLYAQQPHRQVKRYNKARRKILNRPANCSDVYVVAATGVNNNTSTLGFCFDIPVQKSITAEAGVGLGLYGYKIYLGGKYYFSECHRGFALGTGITYNTGRDKFSWDMETVNGTTEKITINLLPQTNLFAAVYHYWTVGDANNRFYIQAGYSQALVTNRFQQTGGAFLSDNSKTILTYLGPGGPILSIGFSVGLNN